MSVGQPGAGSCCQGAPARARAGRQLTHFDGEGPFVSAEIYDLKILAYSCHRFKHFPKVAFACASGDQFRRPTRAPSAHPERTPQTQRSQTARRAPQPYALVRALPRYKAELGMFK